ncbi:MAG: FtsX-like permease family protein [Candidatus Cloacimonadales bacterium]
MIKFLWKGIFRDKSHSLFPILTVSIGVTITVLTLCWMDGMFDEMIGNAAALQTGHLKVVSRAYAEQLDQHPLEYALDNSSDLVQDLQQKFPTYHWLERINFGGIIDVPDQRGETREQGYFYGQAVNLLQTDSPEIELLKLQNSLQTGKLPEAADEILLSPGLFQKLNLSLQETITLLSTSIDGAMTLKNFQVVGTVRFGLETVDRQALIIDISGARDLLYMEDAVSEIFGISRSGFYDDQQAAQIQADFNASYADAADPFSPEMLTLADQQGMRDYINMINSYSSIMITVFVILMSIVLWNSGLIKGIRQYGEFGVRLAIGESKGHLYRSLIAESALIGSIGSIIGTAAGLLIAYYLQEVGVSMGDMLKDSTILISSRVYAKITPTAFYIGFIPGLLASVAGAMLAGRGIYKRQTSQLFKELEQ